MKIFSNTNTPCISKEDFILYKKNLLDNNQRFEIENHALDCSLCSDALDGLEDLEMKDLKITLDEIDIKIDNAKKRKKEKQAKKANIYTLIAKVAAVFIGLVILTIGIKQYTEINREDTLFSNNFKENTFSYQKDGTRGKNSSKSVFDQGVDAYNIKNYALALELFEKAIAIGDSINRFDPYLKAGITSLKLGQLEYADDFLMQVRINDVLQQDQATWYLALSAIKQYQNKKAVAYLTELSNKKGEFQKEATALILKLK